MTNRETQSHCLAIDTSRRGGSICIGSVPRPPAGPAPALAAPALADLTVEDFPPQSPAAVELAAAIDRTLKQSVLDVTHVAVAVGPGSFTGLRVAVTTAKTLAFAWSVPAVGVDSLAAIAHDWFYQCEINHQPSADSPVANSNATDSNGDPANEVMVVCRAYRDHHYVARFQRGRIAQNQSQNQTQMLPESQVQRLIAENTATLLTDRNDLDGGLSIAQNVVPARGVWLAAASQIVAGQCVDPMSLQPNYFRPSAAEEQSRLAAAAKDN